MCAQPCVAMATRSRNLTGFNRVLTVLIFIVFHPYLFARWMKTNDLVLRNNKTRWELFLIWIASVFPQILLKAVSAPAAEPVPLLRPSGGNLISISFPIYSVVFDTSCFKLSNAAFSVPLWSLVQEIIFGENGCLTLCPMAIVNFACCPFCSTASCIFLFVNRKRAWAKHGQAVVAGTNQKSGELPIHILSSM